MVTAQLAILPQKASAGEVITSAVTDMSTFLHPRKYHLSFRKDKGPSASHTCLGTISGEASLALELTHLLADSLTPEQTYSLVILPGSLAQGEVQGKHDCFLFLASA